MTREQLAAAQKYAGAVANAMPHIETGQPLPPGTMDDLKLVLSDSDGVLDASGMTSGAMFACTAIIQRLANEFGGSIPGAVDDVIATVAFQKRLDSSHLGPKAYEDAIRLLSKFRDHGRPLPVAEAGGVTPAAMAFAAIYFAALFRLATAYVKAPSEMARKMCLDLARVEPEAS